MQLLHKYNYSGNIDPDHAVGVAGDKDGRIGFAWELGYIKALRDVVMKGNTETHWKNKLRKHTEPFTTHGITKYTQRDTKKKHQKHFKQKSPVSSQIQGFFISIFRNVYLRGFKFEVQQIVYFARRAASITRAHHQ